MYADIALFFSLLACFRNVGGEGKWGERRRVDALSLSVQEAAPSDSLRCVAVMAKEREKEESTSGKQEFLLPAPSLPLCPTKFIFQQKIKS